MSDFVNQSVRVEFLRDHTKITTQNLSSIPRFECSTSTFYTNGSCARRKITCTNDSVRFVTAAATESRYHHDPNQHHLAPVLLHSHVASGAGPLENSQGIGKLTQWGTGKTPEGGTNSERSCEERGEGRGVSKNIARQTSFQNPSCHSDTSHGVRLFPIAQCAECPVTTTGTTSRPPRGRRLPSPPSTAAGPSLPSGCPAPWCPHITAHMIATPSATWKRCCHRARPEHPVPSL